MKFLVWYIIILTLTKENLNIISKNLHSAVSTEGLRDSEQEEEVFIYQEGFDGESQ